MQLANDPILSLYALTATLVSLHLIVLAAYTGRVRTQHKAFVNPEDVAALKGTQAEADHPDVLRVKRAHMNALENAVPFLAIGLLYALSGAEQARARRRTSSRSSARACSTPSSTSPRSSPSARSCSRSARLATIGMAVHVIRAAL